jgi:hypothetical protein
MVGFGGRGGVRSGTSDGETIAMKGKTRGPGFQEPRDQRPLPRVLPKLSLVTPRKERWRKKGGIRCPRFLRKSKIV